ncbi:MAG: stage 0 sporulation family protein [Clostridia bacterium]|nr:stage 0 sporulation family protein [Clostridia bacterium]
MVEIVGVRFKKVYKIYYFSPEGNTFCCGEHVIVETARGIEFGTVAIANKEIPEDSITSPLKPVIRKATAEDEKTFLKNAEKGKDAFKIALEKIAKHNLNMKLVDVEYTFDCGKALFYFTADGRVDFRELVKDLATVFHTRIELRQIGVRDEAKMLGGFGACGRTLCCHSFLDEFIPVSIKMAKEQSLSLNPTKISGACGRLMCCLKYEQDTYEELNVGMPGSGSLVSTPDGDGTVIGCETLKRSVTVRFPDSPALKSYPVSEIKILKKVQNRNDDFAGDDLKGLE